MSNAKIQTVIPAKQQECIVDVVDNNRTVLKDVTIESNTAVQYIFLLTEDAPDFLDERKVIVEENAQAEFFLCYFGSGNVTVKLIYEIQQNARVNHKLMFFGRDKQHLHFDEQYIFKNTGAYGRFNVQGLVTGEAQSNALGNIFVMPGAQKTDSRLEMSAHILSGQARANIIPSLRVEANDVKAGHAGKVAHLDDESLFYLQSRGLRKDEAKQMMVEGVVQEFVAGMEDEEVRGRILEIAKVIP